MRTTGARCRICRRLGSKLFLKGDRCLSEKCPVTQGAPVPGQINQKHGSGKPSDFKLQLVERQKIRKSYDINERHLRNIFKKSRGQEGKTDDLLLIALERRLDNVVYRAGFATSRAKARQLVSHGHFTLNGRRVDVPSILVRVEDKIAIRAGSAGKKPFDGLKPKSEARWVKVDPKKKEIEIAALPAADDLPEDFQAQSVVESYSR